MLACPSRSTHGALAHLMGRINYDRLVLTNVLCTPVREMRNLRK